MRNRRYNYEPQVVDPGMIDFGSIQMYNPDDVTRLAQAGQNMQQRWDASQSVIAKQLEEIGAANINPRYKADVVGKLEEDLDNIYSNVNTTYQGDFGRAYNDIIKSLSKSRALLHSATQASAEESKLREQYNQLAMQGLAPRVINRTEQGLTPQTLSFEDYYQLPESVFDESGKFVAPQFGALRSAGKHENWLAQNVSEAINRAVVEGDPTLLTGNLAGMARAITTGGMSDTDVESYISKNPWIIESFIANSPFAREEFSDGKGGIRMDDAKEYVTNIVKGQTSQQIKKQFMGSPSTNAGLDRNSLKQQLFSGEIGLRAEQNPIIVEAGNYRNVLDPKFFTKLWRSFSTTEEPVRFNKGKGVTNVDSAIETLENLLTSTGIDSDTRKGALKQLTRYKAVKEDLDIAKNSIKNNIAQSLFNGVNYDALTNEQKEKVDSDPRFPKNDLLLADMLDADDKLLTHSMSVGRTIMHPVTKQKTNELLRENLETWAFSTNRGTSQSNFIDDVIKEDFNTKDVEVIKNYIRTNESAWTYDRSRGEYFINVPKDWESDNGKYKPKPDTKYKKLYFTPDNESKQAKNVLNTITTAINNRNKNNSKILTDGVRFNFQYVAKDNTSPTNKSEPKILMQDTFTGTQQKISIEDLQLLMENMQTELLIDRYTIPFMSLTDQSKTPNFTERYYE